uniref:TSA: Wollemia nobilis Ref_Wollemi_Transcript_22574_1281 transcribed RNA sequence n=1 Tax=Wollemia nobilis TaxID=56998 RepID=A0A0C9RH67_9CONI
MASGEEAPCCDWRSEVRSGGALREVELENGVNGWSAPPGGSFNVRGKDYLSKRVKVKSEECLLAPLGVDWLRSPVKLDHVLGRSDNRVMADLRKAQRKGEALKSFIFAVNLQVPGREHHSAVFYFVTEDPIPPGSLFYRFIHEDDAFRNSRFKLINRIVRGPWIVKGAVGNHAACILGKALTCNYLKGPNYLEIDVEIGSSALASTLVHLSLGYVNCVTVDMAFLVESQTEEDLPERILGAVRIAQIDMASAHPVNNDGGEKMPGVSGQQVSGFAWRKIGRGLSITGHKVDPEEEVNNHQ